MIQAKDLTERQKAELENLVRDAVVTDGAHHKQWYLMQIAEMLDIQVPLGDGGIAP